MSGDSAAVPSTTGVPLPPLRMWAPGSSLCGGGPEDGLAPGFFVERRSLAHVFVPLLEQWIGEGRTDGKICCFREHGTLISSLLEARKESGSKHCEVLILGEKQTDTRYDLG